MTATEYMNMLGSSTHYGLMYWDNGWGFECELVATLSEAVREYLSNRFYMGIVVVSEFYGKEHAYVVDGIRPIARFDSAEFDQ